MNERALRRLGGGGDVVNLPTSRWPRQAVAQRPEWAEVAIEALGCQVAVIDSLGDLVFVNRGWVDFAEENGADPAVVGLGLNYLEVCAKASAECADSNRALEGIRSVLSGNAGRFVMEYACDSPTEKRWFQMTVSLLGKSSYAVVCHADITRQKLSEYQAVEAVREVTRLKRRLEAENLYLREEIQTEHDFENIVGTSAALMGVLAQIEIVAATNATVLFTGETGTGKELIARALHERSKRADKPLVTVNCASLPDTLIESELFGHVRGAFSGATNRRVGRFELTDKGTILLDEVGELPLELQAKLLRVLQSGEFEPLGSSQTKKVDVRVIAATNRDLESEVDEGKFRADLYYRLSVFPIEVPPLRDRSEDIPLLVAYFLDQKSRSIGKKVDHISESGMAALVAYDWPGNVRELENFIERAVILCPGSTLRLESATPVGASDNQSAAPIVLLGSVAGDRPDATMRIAEIPPRPTDAGGAGGSPPACPIPMTLEEVERQHILDVLEACEWKVKGSGNAADRLGLNPSTLRSRLKKLGIRRPSR